jgi:carbon monoxide dehydrogenase subunit G
MRFEGVVNIQAPRKQVYNMLIDPDFVAQCAPGVDSMEEIEPGRKYSAMAAVGFGSVSSKFKTTVEFLEKNENESAKVKAHGNAPGSAVDATSEMKLSDGEAGSTDLTWSADVNIMGTLASTASRLMGPITKKLAGAFFDCVKSKIEA